MCQKTFGRLLLFLKLDLPRLQIKEINLDHISIILTFFHTLLKCKNAIKIIEAEV